MTDPLRPNQGAASGGSPDPFYREPPAGTVRRYVGNSEPVVQLPESGGHDPALEVQPPYQLRSMTPPTDSDTGLGRYMTSLSRAPGGEFWPFFAINLIAAVLLVGLTIGCSAVAASIPPETTPGRNLVMELWEISLVRIVLVAAALWSLACFLPTARVAWVRFKHGQPNVSLARVPSPGRTIRRRDVIRAEDPIAYWTGWSEWRYTWALYHSRK